MCWAVARQAWRVWFAPLAHREREKSGPAGACSGTAGEPALPNRQAVRKTPGSELSCEHILELMSVPRRTLSCVYSGHNRKDASLRDFLRPPAGYDHRSLSHDREDWR